MRFVAQFDLTADVSAPDDIEQKSIEHPNGDFKFIIRRKTVNEGNGTVTLHCNMAFDAAALDQAKEDFMSCVLRVLDILALVTHASIKFHRLHKIFDLSRGKTMRQGLMFVHDPPEPEPTTFLEPHILDAASLFLKAEVGEKVLSALRWFRLGVVAESPEDQFQHFWFALELLAVHEKPAEDVQDLCPKCECALYCEACKEYPTHKPYPKQAIAHLCATIAPDAPDFFSIANKTLNMMMHGSSVEKIERKIGHQLHQIIDPLGKIVWIGLLNDLVKSLPEGDRPTELSLGQASTFVKWDMSAAVVMETVVPLGPDGEPDIELMTGITAGFTH